MFRFNFKNHFVYILKYLFSGTSFLHRSGRTKFTTSTASCF
jgi:hypothetical protein